MISTATGIVMLLVGISLCSASAADAQIPIGEGGLFGSEARRARRTADVVISVSETRDDDISIDQTATPSPGQTPVEGYYSGLDVTGAIAQTTRRFSLAANGTSVLRRYPSLDSFVASNYAAGADLSALLGSKSTFRASVAASHATSFALDAFTHQGAVNQERPSFTGPLDGAAIASTPLDSTRSSRGATLEWNRTFGRHTTLGITGSAWSSDRPIAGESSVDRSAAIELRRTVGHDTAVQASYSVHVGSELFGGVATRIVSHDVQASVDQQWRHS